MSGRIPGVRLHATAIVEDGVQIGEGTAIWDAVHLRSGARIGSSCIVGEKTYIAGGTSIGDLVKINAFVYICAGVTIERGAMIAAGTVFTNDLFPRAATTDLRRCSNPKPLWPVIPKPPCVCPLSISKPIGSTFIIKKWPGKAARLAAGQSNPSTASFRTASNAPGSSGIQTDCGTCWLSMCCCAITTSTFSGIKKYAISIQGINRLSVLIRRCARSAVARSTHGNTTRKNCWAGPGGLVKRNVLLAEVTVPAALHATRSVLPSTR